MKKRRLYIGTSLLILLLLFSTSFFVAFGGAEGFLNKDGSLSTGATAVLCVCILFSVCDIALLMLTKRGKSTINQGLSQWENVLVYLTAIILISTLVSYFTLFCANTLSKSAYETPHQSIVDIISST